MTGNEKDESQEARHGKRIARGVEGGEGRAGDGTEQRGTATADIGRLWKHRNPLDAIAEAIRMESRDRGPEQVRMEHVLARVNGLGLSAPAAQEGTENLVSPEVVVWTPGGPVRWRKTEGERRNRSKSPTRITGWQRRNQRRAQGGASDGGRNASGAVSTV